MTNLVNANVNTNNDVTPEILIDNNTNVINLTPHDVVIQRVDGSFETIKSSGEARITTFFQVTKLIRGIRVGQTVAGGITGLPEPAEDTLYIVSLIFLKYVRDRFDLVAPNEQVRDEHGKVLYAKSLTC